MLWVVKRGFFISGFVAVACLAPPLWAQPRGQALPPLPSEAGQTAGDGAPAQAAIPQGLTPQQLYERVRRGVVAIERGGVPVAIGTVLGGDGRILTALSALGSTDGVDVRYADGTTVHTKAGPNDKGLDLAVLLPQSGKWTDGLGASEADPNGAGLRAMLPLRGHLGPTEAALTGRADTHTRNASSLRPGKSGLASMDA